MSLRKIEARLVAHEDTTGDVRAVRVFDHVLTENFSEIEVDDHVLGKLRGNPHIEVVEPKPRRTRAATVESGAETADPVEQPEG